MAQGERFVPRGRALDAALVSVGIEEEAQNLRREKTWQSGDRNAVTLVKTPRMRVVLMALRNGASLREHHVEGPITVLVMEGSINFIVGQETCHLHRNGFVSLEGTIPHDVEALEDSVVLLTIMQPGNS